jgi:acetyl-CoA carboxylase carboxyltransferase component
MAELQYTLSNPLPEPAEAGSEPTAVPTDTSAAAASAAAGATSAVGPYDAALALGEDLNERPLVGGGPARVRTQHAKDRMTVWERIKVLTDQEPMILYRNWGPELDGASIVTGILDIGGRDVAVYGHDFTVRAGSMDATNGAKLARLIYMAG